MVLYYIILYCLYFFSGKASFTFFYKCSLFLVRIAHTEFGGANTFGPVSNLCCRAITVITVVPLPCPLPDDDFRVLGSVFWALVFRFLGLPPVAVCGVASVEKEMKYLSGLKVIILLKSGGNQRIHILKSTCGISEVCRSPPRQFQIGGVSLSHFPRSGDRGVAKDVASVASLFRSRPFSKTEN